MTSAPEGRRPSGKVAIVGGGGFRVPMVVAALDALAPALALDEIVLYDVDGDRTARMELVVRGMRNAAGTAHSTATLRRTSVLAEAVADAFAVLVAIRVGGTRGRVVDERVPLELGVLGQETVGPAGIALAIRTLPIMREIAREVAARAPSAWFLNFTNPVGIVTQAVRPILGDRAVGICDSPNALRAHVVAALGATEGLLLDYVGLNHLGWVVDARVDDRDALSDLLADEDRLEQIDEVRLVGVDEVRRLGAIPNEYLVYFRRTDEIVASFRIEGPRGAVVDRQVARFLEREVPDADAAFRAWRRAVDERHGTYLAEARSRGSGDHSGAVAKAEPSVSREPELTGYGGVATAFLLAATRPAPTDLELNVANGGRSSFLDDDDVIEATCDVSASGVRTRFGRALPDEAAALVARVKEVERLTIRAAIEGRVDLALEAIASHPVVPSRTIAERILAGYMANHATLRRILR